MTEILDLSRTSSHIWRWIVSRLSRLVALSATHELWSAAEIPPKCSLASNHDGQCPGSGSSDRIKLWTKHNVNILLSLFRSVTWINATFSRFQSCWITVIMQTSGATSCPPSIEMSSGRKQVKKNCLIYYTSKILVFVWKNAFGNPSGSFRHSMYVCMASGENSVLSWVSLWTWWH